MDKRKKRKDQVQQLHLRDLGDGLIIKTDPFKYSEVFKAMRRDIKLMDIITVVRRRISRTSIGKIILELRKKTAKLTNMWQ